MLPSCNWLKNVRPNSTIRKNKKYRASRDCGKIRIMVSNLTSSTSFSSISLPNAYGKNWKPLTDEELEFTKFQRNEVYFFQREQPIITPWNGILNGLLTVNNIGIKSLIKNHKCRKMDDFIHTIKILIWRTRHTEKLMIIRT